MFFCGRLPQASGAVRIAPPNGAGPRAVFRGLAPRASGGRWGPGKGEEEGPTASWAGAPWEGRWFIDSGLL